MITLLQINGIIQVLLLDGYCAGVIKLNPCGEFKFMPIGTRQLCAAVMADIAYELYDLNAQ